MAVTIFYFVYVGYDLIPLPEMIAFLENVLPVFYRSLFGDNLNFGFVVAILIWLTVSFNGRTRQRFLSRITHA